MKKITRDAESVLILKSEKSFLIKLSKPQNNAVIAIKIIGANANKISLIE